MTAVVAPELLPPHYPTDTPEALWRGGLRRLSGAKAAWSRSTPAERIELLKVCLNGVQLEARDWVRAACRAKGHLSGEVGEGEEWLAGPVPVVRNIRLLIEALEADGKPDLPGVRSRADGQQVVDVFPATRKEQAVFNGLSAEVWLEPGQRASQGAAMRPLDGGRLCVVLGAGNVSSIAPMDVLYKIFVEGQVVVLKMNPVNAYVGPYIARAFWRLIEANLFTVVYGGAALGAALVTDPAVDTLHITGSHHTHDAIVWGPRSSRKRRKNTRPITSELGCVTPILVAPGDWKDDELQLQARQVATMVANNASFNCNAAQILVMSSDCRYTPAFLAAVEDALKKIPTRKAYYPGAVGRWRAMVDRYPDAKRIGSSDEERLPWAILPDVPAQTDEYALQAEAFCGVLGVLRLPGTDAGRWLSAAAAFCNANIWGNLSAGVLAPAATPEAAIDAAVAELRYGTIGVNLWPAVGYALVSTPWGAFPGNPLDDIQSGQGFVHNTMMLDYPQKAVVRAPSVLVPDPIWLADNDRSHRVGPRLMDFEASPRWRRLPGLALASLAPPPLFSKLLGTR
ncbi:MAG: aldehyde dehydrogenase family protein [Myxococcota bacterium]